MEKNQQTFYEKQPGVLSEDTEVLKLGLEMAYKIYLEERDRYFHFEQKAKYSLGILTFDITLLSFIGIKEHGIWNTSCGCQRIVLFTGLALMLVATFLAIVYYIRVTGVKNLTSGPEMGQFRNFMNGDCITFLNLLAGSYINATENNRPIINKRAKELKKMNFSLFALFIMQILIVIILFTIHLFCRL